MTYGRDAHLLNEQCAARRTRVFRRSFYFTIDSAPLVRPLELVTREDRRLCDGRKRSEREGKNVAGKIAFPPHSSRPPRKRREGLDGSSRIHNPAVNSSLALSCRTVAAALYIPSVYRSKVPRSSSAALTKGKRRNSPLTQYGILRGGGGVWRCEQQQSPRRIHKCLGKGRKSTATTTCI